MDLLIGFFSFLLVTICFSLIEKKRINKIGNTKYFFFLYVLFSSYLFKPSQDILLWVGLCFLLYSVLDDILSLTTDVLIPIAVTVYFLIYLGNFHAFLFSFVFFLIFLLSAKLSKERIIGEGDAYLILPLLLLIDPRDISIVLLISFFTLVIVSTPFRLLENSEEFPFAPYMFIATIIVISNFYVDIIFITTFFLSISCSIFLLIRQLINKKKKNKKSDS